MLASLNQNDPKLDPRLRAMARKLAIVEKLVTAGER